jgi:hypothetical protein
MRIIFTDPEGTSETEAPKFDAGRDGIGIFLPKRESKTGGMEL